MMNPPEVESYKVFWAQRGYGLDLTVLNRDALPPFVVRSHLAGNEQADEIVDRHLHAPLGNQSKEMHVIRPSNVQEISGAWRTAGTYSDYAQSLRITPSCQA